MNIYEFCEEFRIPIRKARKMQEAGVLRLDLGESKHGSAIRMQLRRGQHLTVSQLLVIIENPSILRELGHYREKAERQIAELGDFRSEVAPREVAAYISDAARQDDAALVILIGWMKEFAPSKPVTHYWFAVRLLMGIPANIRGYDIPRIGGALLNCRKHKNFAGWWRVENIGSRRVTFYRRPQELYDL